METILNRKKTLTKHMIIKTLKLKRKLNKKKTKKVQKNKVSFRRKDHKLQLIQKRLNKKE